MVEAEKLAHSITQQFPNHPFAWKVLGSVYRQSGRNDQALHACQQTVQLVPQDPAAHYNLGNALKDLGRLQDAQSSYQKAIQLKPDFAEAPQ